MVAEARGERRWLRLFRTAIADGLLDADAWASEVLEPSFLTVLAHPQSAFRTLLAPSPNHDHFRYIRSSEALQAHQRLHDVFVHLR